MTRRSQIIWSVLILTSFAFQTAVLLLEAGYYSTPFGTADSSGNQLGFNNPITNELVWILIGNVRLDALVGGFRSYFLVGLIAHLVGLGLIWGPSARRTRLLYFGSQMLIFPLGWLPIFWMGPLVVINCFFGTFDGETITDGPLNMFWAHVTWWQVSLVMFLWELGFKDAWMDTRSLSVPPSPTRALPT